MQDQPSALLFAMSSPKFVWASATRHVRQWHWSKFFGLVQLARLVLPCKSARTCSAAASAYSLSVSLSKRALLFLIRVQYMLLDSCENYRILDDDMNLYCQFSKIWENGRSKSRHGVVWPDRTSQTSDIPERHPKCCLDPLCLRRFSPGACLNLFQRLEEICPTAKANAMDTAIIGVRAWPHAVISSLGARARGGVVGAVGLRRSVSHVVGHSHLLT